MPSSGRHWNGVEQSFGSKFRVNYLPLEEECLATEQRHSGRLRMCNFGEFIVVEWTAIPVKFYLIHFFKSTQLGTFELIFLNIVWIIHSYDVNVLLFFNCPWWPGRRQFACEKNSWKRRAEFHFQLETLPAVKAFAWISDQITIIWWDFVHSVKC